MKRLTNILKQLCPPRPVCFLVATTLLGALLFTAIRLVLYFENRELLATGIDHDSYWVMRAMGVGFRFDLNLAFMLMLPSALLLAASQFMGNRARWAANISTAWLVISYAATLFTAIVNIPYFSHFQAHVNAMSMKYATTGMGDLMAMIHSERSYLIYFTAAIITAVAYGAVITLLGRKCRLSQPSSRRKYALTAIAILALMYIWADRGFYLRHRTLEPRDTKISNNAFINKLGVNPIEPFVLSLGTTSDTVQLMEHTAARDMVVAEMKRGTTLLKHIEAKPSPWRNMVIIVAESCAAKRLQHEGATEQLMPHLDRMVSEGVYFENTYSSGTHTCNAIYSLVTSLPSFVDRHPLQDGLERPLNTMLDQVHSRGALTTLFYVTHGPNYDNVRSFTTTQGFERLMSRNNYGVETDKMWGVDDHVMFDYAINDIEAEWQKGNAFGAVMLTCSNHSPYNPPLDVGFTPTTTEPELQAVEYADWAMNRFMTMASEREWFNETLFIIVGDHGRALTTDFEIPESINHVPLLFYSPKHLAPAVRSDLATQMDIIPTALAMLGLEHTNNSLGIDLNTDSRRLLPYGHDGYIAARDHHWLYIYDVHSDMPYLYNLDAEGDMRTRNIAAEHAAQAKDMHNYAAAMTQAGWDIHNAHAAWQTTHK